MNASHSLLYDTIKKVITVSDNEIEVLNTAFKVVTKNKNEFLVREGAISRNLYFVVSGYLRCFYIDDGNDITTQFATTKDFITSFESFLNNEFSKENIQCISDCILLSISRDGYEQLYQEVLNWPMFCKSVYESHIIKLSQRANTLQNLPASKRYLNFLNAQPNIALNTSVKHLASYLGIKPQSLSRIRKEIIK